MGGAASKNKGKAAERELCKILGEAFDNSNFERVPFSGAMIGGKNAHRKERMDEDQIRVSKSDIIPPSHLKKMVIESKFYADFPYHAFALNKDIPLLDKWIKDLEFDCDKGDVGFLCVKINRKGWFVCVQEHYDYILPNHAVYKGYVVTDLHKFLTDNKNKILHLAK